MLKSVLKSLLCCIILVLHSHNVWSKPGDYGGLLGEYGAPELGGAYQTLPDPSGLLSNADLKPASTYDIGYGAPIAEQIVPFPVRGFGWGWKQPIPQPIITPIQVIAKPVPFPVTIPVGWGWQSPGIF